MEEVGQADDKNNLFTKLKYCYRCKVENDKFYLYCLNCKKVAYCSEKCKKRNFKEHDILCNYYLTNFAVIKETMSRMDDNYGFVKNAEQRQNLKKKK